MAFPTDREFAALLARLASQLRGRGLPFMVVGGQAVLLHGEPRLTQDIDLTIAASIDHIKRWAVEFSEVPGREDLPQQVASLEEQGGLEPGSA